MEIHLTLPKKWSDITPEQLRKLSMLFIRYQDKPEFLTRCFLLFSGWSIVRWRMWIKPDGLYFYFREPKAGVFSITSDLFRDLVNQIQWITKGFQTLPFVPALKGFRSPNLYLYNITLEQFLMAENFYNAFIETGDFRKLDRLLACLYCNSFEHLNVNKVAKTIGRRAISDRYACFIWFSGVKSWLSNKYPYIFSASDSKEDAPPDAVVLNLLSSLNEGDITRNGKILKTRMHEAFHELNNKIEYSKSIKHV